MKKLLWFFGIRKVPAGPRDINALSKHSNGYVWVIDLHRLFRGRRVLDRLMIIREGRPYQYFDMGLICLTTRKKSNERIDR